MFNRVCSSALVLALILLTFGCGKRVNKQGFGPDQYFEYAKKKFDDGDYLEAITDFTVIVLKFSGDPVVDDAQYFLGESHFNNSEYLIAISEYQKLVNDYPQSPYATLGQFKIALAYYRLSPRPELDQQYTHQAVREFQNFLQDYPDHELKANAEELIKEMREKLAVKMMMGATTYRKMGICSSASYYYDAIIEKYYDTEQAPDAHYWKGECLFKVKKFEESMSAFTVYVEKFPEHKFAGKAKNRISELSDELENADKEDGEKHTGIDGNSQK